MPDFSLDTPLPITLTMDELAFVAETSGCLANGAPHPGHHLEMPSWRLVCSRLSHTCADLGGRTFTHA
jgi:hypothetical protein